MKKLLLFLFVLTFSIPIYSLAQTCIIPAGGIINGGASGCTDRVATYTISGVTNATTYNWVITGAQDFTRVSDTEYSIVFASANVTIQVTPINQTNGPCSGPVITKTVNVASSPGKPSISQTSTTLTSTSAASYQWYVSNTLIVGAISQTYNPTQSGLYRVEAKNTTTGCSTFSDPFNYFTTGIREDARFKTFNFYPNPVVTSLHTNFSERYNLEFYDTSGRKVFENINLNGEQETDLTSLNRGIYLMRIISGDKRATRKLILK